MPGGLTTKNLILPDVCRRIFNYQPPKGRKYVKSNVERILYLHKNHWKYYIYNKTDSVAVAYSCMSRA